MSDLFVVHEMVILPHMVASSWEDAIDQLGMRMSYAGFTDSSYTGCVIEREREFPTALQLDSTAVALPHGAPEHVWVPSMAIGRCERPVAFHSLNDPAKTIDVQLVVLLAMDDPESHLGVLGRLTQALTDSAFCEDVLAMDTSREIASAFRTALELDR